MKPELSFVEIAEKHGLKASEDGERLVGLVKSFPVYVEKSPFKEGKSVVVTLRLRSFEDVEGFEEAVQKSDIVDASRLTMDVRRDCIDYVFLRTSEMKYGDIFDDRGEVVELIGLVERYLGKPRAVCERCGSGDVKFPVIDGRVPVLLCGDCAGSRVKDRDGLKETYGVVLHSYGRGVKLGLIGVVAGGVLMPVLAYLTGMSDPKIYSILIAVVIPYLVKRGVGRVNNYVYLISAGLAIFSIFIERTIFYLLLGERPTVALMAFLTGIRYTFHGRLFFIVLPLVACAVTLLVLKRLEQKDRVAI